MRTVPKEAIAEELERRHVPGLAVALIESGELSATDCWGTRTTSGDDLVGEDTVFEAASMSKPVTAYMTLRLAEQGAFELDVPLMRYTKQRHVDDPRIELVTGRHALTHRSGLWRDSKESVPYFEREPGAAFKYSNEGFVYLQVALEEITGRSFEDLAQELVFAPLRMRDSSFVWRESYTRQTAHPHDQEGRPLEKWRPTVPWAPGGMHTTAPDFARFVAAMLPPPRSDRSGPDSIAEMLRPQVEVHESWGGGPPEPGSCWGLGWALQTSPPASFWHWGWNDGFLSFAVAWPAERRGVVAFTNGMNGLRLCKDVVTWFSRTVHPAFRWLGH